MENAEDYVSFEVAMLLKEKGFDERGLCVYVVEDKSLIVFGDWVENSCLLEHLIAAPTHQMALKWLREVPKMDIEIITYWTKDKNRVYGNRVIHNNVVLKEIDTAYNSYEQAVEAALKYALENLI